MIGILIWEGALKKAFVRCLCLHPMLLKMELGSELMSTGSDGDCCMFDDRQTRLNLVEKLL